MITTTQLFMREVGLLPFLFRGIGVRRPNEPIHRENEVTGGFSPRVDFAFARDPYLLAVHRDRRSRSAYSCCCRWLEFASRLPTYRAAPSSAWGALRLLAG